MFISDFSPVSFALIVLSYLCSISAPLHLWYHSHINNCVMEELEHGKRSQSEAAAITGLIAPTWMSTFWMYHYQNSFLITVQVSAVWMGWKCSLREVHGHSEDLHKHNHVIYSQIHMNIFWINNKRNGTSWDRRSPAEPTSDLSKLQG